MLKKELEINVDEMHKLVTEYFAQNRSCLLKLGKAELDKNLDDLETKGYL